MTTTLLTQERPESIKQTENMLEIACFTPSSALLAAHAGATRIELCTSYPSGGLTPSLNTLSYVYPILSSLSPPVPIYIMIRPRAGNFTYTPSEFDTMRNDIVRLKPFASGFVFGILDYAGNVDVARCCELLDLAEPLACTFHRAVDEVAQYEGAVEIVVACGFSSVLTSGGAKSAEEGVEKVKKIVERLGSKIDVILAGGVRSTNVEGIKRDTGVRWLHSSAITAEGEEADEEEVKRLKAALAQYDANSTSDGNVTMS